MHSSNSIRGESKVERQRSREWGPSKELGHYWDIMELFSHVFLRFLIFHDFQTFMSSEVNGKVISSSISNNSYADPRKSCQKDQRQKIPMIPT